MITELMAAIEKELQGGAKKGVPSSVAEVKQTCREATQAPNAPVRVDEEKVRFFATHLPLASVKSSSHLMDNPLQFSDEYAEINFLLTLHLCNFGHGFRHPLHTLCGVGAWQTMKKGITALHNDAHNGCIDAETLIRLTKEKIHSFFQLPAGGVSGDHAHLNLLASIIEQVAHQTGTRLLALGYPSFADFLFDHASATQPSAQRLVAKLAEHFPAFDDRRVLSSGKEVIFLKKAQLAIAELFQKVGDRLAGTISFADIRQCTVACDNVLPSVLRTLGILQLDPELAATIDNRHPLLAGDEEAALRAAAITATEHILEIDNGSFWSKELGDYLWTLGKEPRFRKVERHATVNTCFY